MRGAVMLACFSALSAVTLAGVPAFAATSSYWDHNGSRMALEEDGSKRKIVYSEPKQGLDKAGIRPGTVLFEGERKGDGRLAGNARIFKGGCNPIDYFVEGTLDPRKGEIVLQGQAPVYAQQGCEVSGYSETSPASTLTFAGISPPEPAATAQVQPDDQIEQGDRAPSNDDYLPPAASSTDRYARRYEPEADYDARRNRFPRAEEESRGDDFFRPRERYGRAPNTFEDDPYRRRRPSIYEQDDDFYSDEEAIDSDLDRPLPPFWWRRRPY